MQRHKPIVLAAILVAAAPVVADAKAAADAEWRVADATITVLRGTKGGSEAVSVPDAPEPRRGKAGAEPAENAGTTNIFCPAPYRMTERDGCQMPHRR